MFKCIPYSQNFAGQKYHSSFLRIMFCQCDKNCHRLYVIINMGQKKLWDKISLMRARGEKGKKFLQVKISGYTAHNDMYKHSYSATTLNLNTNPAYEARTPLQRNIAYEDTTLNTREPEESQTKISQADPTYETIPLASTHISATT